MKKNKGSDYRSNQDLKRLIKESSDISLAKEAARIKKEQEQESQNQAPGAAHRLEIGVQSKPDKIIVSNSDALRAKYGTAGVQALSGAIAKLIAADLGRNLQSIFVAVNDAKDMKVAGGAAVMNAADAQQNKNAVDALYSFHKPQYMVLLGSTDVIPHQDLTNPAYNPAPNGDPDRVAPSDLPYACDAAFSQNISDFIGPSRVVSRLPDVKGANDPAYLIHLLELASNATALTQADYADYLGVSASVWNQSTALSLNAVFGSSVAMHSVPPTSYQWSTSLLTRRSHFFNCHGGQLFPQYLGQIGKSYPVAHDASYIAGKLMQGTVASVECCYGAELYDPASVPNQQMGIANVYLGDGAYGFWGSTTIAYGPSNSNANADLICQYFLREVLNGSSVGGAALSARQTFVQNTPAMSPVDLKTLAQFILLGDASIRCVPSADAGAKTASKFALMGISEGGSERLSRIERREQFARQAQMLQSTKAVSETVSRPVSPDVRRKLDQIREAMGLQKTTYASYGVKSGPETKRFGLGAAAVPQRNTPSAFHLVFEKSEIAESRATALRIIEVTEADGEFIRVRELFSR